ncbi:MAG TPA: glutamate--tRNA ligase family protein [bacterium]|nr:glutamate--tRNA ligase family protein [bacterium]
MRGRLAPTPSGYLHIGNAFSFIITWCLTRRLGGTLLLRIDDLDTDRKRPDFVADIFENLAWLGLDWQEGPRDIAGFDAAWSQDRRMPLYRAAIERLRAIPGALFACECSRGQLAHSGATGRYPGICRDKGLPLDTPGTKLRFRTPDSAFAGGFGPQAGDFIVWKKDDRPAYQLASVVDDEHFGVTHIVRGADLRDSTAMQLLLAGTLGYTCFPQARFLHHPLLVDREGRKFSKSDGSLSLRALREGGVTAAAIYRWVAGTLGVTVKVAQAGELLDACDENRLMALDISVRGEAPIPVAL